MREQRWRMIWNKGKPYLRVILFLAVICLIEWQRAGVKGYDEGIASDQFRLIEQSQVKRNAYNLVMGDSVTSQMFGNNHIDGGTYYMTGNCSATMGGFYLLMRNYIEHNPQTREIRLVVSPDVIANAADTDYTYQYYIVPYYTKENMRHITANVQNYIDRKFGYLFTRCEPIKKVLYNDLYLLGKYRDYIEATRTKERKSMRISWFSAEYLKQMQALCDANEIEFTVLSCPLSNTRARHDWGGFQKDREQYGLKKILQGYMENADYYSEDEFQDEYHFETEVLRAKKQQIIKKLWSDY